MKKCGHPEPRLILVDPAKDRALQAEVKAKRLMTVFQDSVGNKADRGVVGFEPGPGRQFLVFPKPLKGFEGRNVIGIKYDLLSEKEPPKSERAPAIKAKKPKKPKRTAPLPENILLMPSMSSGDGSGAKHKKEDRNVGHPESEEREDAKTVQMDKRAKPREEAAARLSAGNPEVQEIKSGIRKAIKALEQGKQVVAFNLLKRLADE